MYCDKNVLNKWKEIERSFTRILTFFIGFYVSLTVRNWWEMVKSLPRLDGICFVLNSSLWVDPTKKEDEVKVTSTVTAKQLRFTIVRYFLLSWTMCLSRVSLPMNRNFKDAKAYNAKKLLLKREYEELIPRNESDGWREKWATPLLWVTNLLNVCDTPNMENFVKIKDFREIGKEVAGFYQDLRKISNYYQYRLPGRIRQAVTIAMYYFLIIGILSSQGNYHQAHGSGLLQIVLDFPAYHLIKFILLFGWLKAASEIEDPFGDDT